MKKILLLFILYPLFLFGQTQMGQDITGEAIRDNSGWSLSLSSDGSIVAIGAPFNDGNGNDSGHVRIYKNINNVWTQIGDDINGETAGDHSGWSLSLSSDGSIVAIGAPSNDENGSNSGHVRIYKNINNVWTQIGDDINGKGINESFGTTISLSSNGSIVAIGVPGKNVNGDYSGGIRIYKNTNNVWQQIGDDINGETAGDEAGRRSLSLNSDGSIVAFGAPENDGNGISSGHVRVYKNMNNIWQQLGNDIDGEAAGIKSGYSISLSYDGSIIAVGAPSSYDNGNSTGHVRVYKNTNNDWQQVGIDIDGDLENDNSGSSLSLSSDGSILAIGAPESNSGDFRGKIKIFDITNFSLSKDNFVLFKFNIFPIPAKNLVTIKLRDELILEKISVYNSLGQFIKISKEMTIDISTLSKGIYFLQVETNKGKSTKKLVIE